MEMSKAEGHGARPQGQGSGAGAAARSGEKLEHLLAAAADLMARQGYDQTSIRHVARETGFSLAGMYYYFENKEDLLYQIQHRTFASLLEEQERAMAEDGKPDEKLRRLLRNHLSYFTRHFNELKVCTFELQSLQGDRYRTIERLRRRYFRCTAEVVGEMMGLEGRQIDRNRSVRHHTLFIFGVLNWIFMWFDPERDGPAEKLCDEVISMVLHGLVGVQTE